MSIAVGIDGIRGGWLAAWRGGAGIVLRTFSALENVLATIEPGVVAVDVPIGLPAGHSRGGRECEVQARQTTGLPRSVFSTPPRSVVELAVADHAAAAAAMRTRFGASLSRQSFELLPKIREADAVVRSRGQDRIVEVHPEVCFWRMKGGRLTAPKSCAAGLMERVRLLQDVADIDPLGDAPMNAEALRRAGLDDVLDALAALWTAERVLARTADRLPADPPMDDVGLRMEMWA